MPNVLDDNVVILRFDNADFEKNTKQSMETLDKLKSSLDNNGGESFKNLGRAANSINLSGLSKSIDTINNRFSNLGIVGMSVINRLTNSAIDSAKNIVTSIPKQMIEGGWKRALNIEQAEYLMKGLGVKFDGFFDKETKAFEGVKGAVLASVHETRYGLDEAAKAAATLLASDEKLADNAELLADRLKAISGVAAVTSSDYQSIAYIFTKVAGQGRMMTNELNMLSMKGFNAAVEIRNYLNQNGKIKEQALENAIAMGHQTKKMQEIATHAKLTEGDVREMVAAGAIDFNIMSNSLLHFFDTAAGANETFEGSLANVKASFSRMGAQLEAPKLKNLTRIFNYLLPVLQKFESFLEPFTAKIAKFSDRVTTFIGEGLINPLGRALGAKNKDLFHGFGEAAKEAAEKIDSANKKTQTSSSKTGKELLKLNKEYQAARDIWYKGSYGIGSRRKNALEQIGVSYVKTQGIINQFYKDGFKWDKIEKQLIRDYDNKAKATTESTKATKKSTQETKKQVEQYPTMVALVKGFVNILASGKLVLEGVKNILVTVGGALKQAIAPGLKAGANGLSSFTDKILSAAKRFNNFTKIFKKDFPTGEWFKKQNPLVQKFFTALRESFNFVKNALESAINKLQEFFDLFRNSDGFSYLKDQLKNIAEGSLDSFIDKIKTLNDAMSSGSTANVIGALSSWTTKIDGFTSSIKRGENPLKSYSKVIDRVKDTISFKSIGASIGNAELTALSASNAGVDSIVKSATALKNANIPNIFAPSMKSIVNFFDGIKESVGGVDFKDNFQKVFDAFKNADWESISKTALQIVSIGAIIKMVRDMGSLTNAAVGVLGSISGFFGSLSGIASAYKKQITVKNISILAISLSILIGSIVALATVPTDRMIPAMAGVVVIMGMMVSVMAMMNSNKFDPAKMRDAGLAFAGMGGALLMVATACKILAGIQGDDLFKAGAAITIFIGMFVAAAKMKGEIAKAGLTFLAMGAAVNMLVFAVMAFAMMPWGAILKGAMAIGIITTELVLASRLAGKTNVKGLASMALALNLLLPPIIVFSIMPVDKALRGAIVVTTIIAMIGLASRTAGKSAGNMMTLFTMATMITSLTAALVILSFIDSKKLILAATSITAVVTSIAIAANVASHSKAGMAMMSVSIAILTASIIALMKIDADGAMKVANSLSLLALSLAASFGIFSLIGVQGSLIGLAGLSIAIGGITAIIMALGGIAQIPHAKWLIKEGKKFAQLLGDAIGSFVGGIVAGFGVAATSGLPTMGKNLSSFMEEIKPFVDLAKDIDPKSTQGIKNLSNAIVQLTKAEFLDQLSFLGGSNSIEQFAEDLTSFASGFVDFSSKVNEIPEDSVDKAKKVSDIIAALASATNKIPKSGGLAQGLTGTIDIENFIKSMIDVAKALSSNGGVESISNLEISDDLLGDNGKITKIAEVITTLASAMKKIPKSGGIQQGFTGNTTLAEFGGQLNSFAVMFGGFSRNISDLTIDDSLIGDNGKIAKICDIIATMSNAAKLIPPSAGIKQLFTGNTTISEFATQLGLAVPGIKSFINSAGTESIDPNAVKQVKPIAQAVAAMAIAAQEIPETGGFKNILFGGHDLGAFASQLSQFIPGFQQFSSGVADLQIDNSVIAKIPKICEAISAMAEVSKSLPKTGGWSQALVGEKNIGKFGAQLRTLLESLNGIKGGNINVSTISKAGEAINAIVPSIQNFKGVMPIPKGENLATLGTNAVMFATSLGNANTSNLSSNASAISSAVSKLGKSASKGVKSLGNATSGISKAGADLGAQFAKGIKSKSKAVEAAAKSLAGKAKSGAASKKADMASAGKSVGQGFVNGILAKKTAAYNAGKALGISAKKGAKKAIDSNSPAKEFIKLGKYSGEGLVMGLASYEKLVYKAGYDIGEQSITGSNDAISSVFDGISEPTIRPVMDLSGVNQGVQQIGTMFDNQIPFSFAPNFDSVKNQNDEITNLMINMISKLDDLASANNQLDPTEMYEAVRLGASNARIHTSLNDRELTRGLQDLGVVFR